jgi:rhamnosyltransferase
LLTLKPADVIAVVVTYNPDWTLLREQTLRLLPQVGRVIWVDNASQHSPAALAAELGVSFVALPRNQGIAYAHNHGVQWALAQSVPYVLLMDHDSLPEPDMVNQLGAVMLQQPDAAAVGPKYVDPRSETPCFPFVWIEGFKLQRLHRQDAEACVKVDHLIASGCLIRAEAWRSVGAMSEPLFIDFVDVEWCLRARAQGWHLYGVWNAGMLHTIGHDTVQHWGRNFRIHSPLRHYYHIRNGVYLYRQSWIPWNWRVVSGWRMMLKIGFYLLLGQNRWAYARSTWQGLRDGWDLQAPVPMHFQERQS